MSALDACTGEDPVTVDFEVDLEVDFEAIFAQQPTAYLVMSPELVIVEANRAYLELLGRSREELLGRYVFDAFPPAEETLDANGDNPLQLSFERARDTGEPDPMPLFRYEVLDHLTGQPSRRAWSLISVPVQDSEGRTRLVLQRVEDVSEYLAERERLGEAGDDGGWARLDGLEADLFARTRELRTALDAQEAATRRLAAMAQVVLQLTDAETVEDITGILAGTGLAAIGADGGAIALRDDERGVVQLTLTPSLGAGTQQRFGTIGLDSRLPAAWVARTGETVVHEDQAQAELWSAEMRETFEHSGQRAWITVPLSAGGRLLGSLLAGWTTERTFTEAEVELVQAFAAQCAQALVRLQALTQARREATRSRQLAEELQRGMLPEPLRPDHCQLAVRYLPATRSAQVGGDWYDTFLQADGAVNVVIGDVVGHDTGAAATMGQLRSLLRGITVSGDAGPAQVLDRLDGAITQLGLATYATVGMGRLEQTAQERERGVTRLRWASAGHLPPMVVDVNGAFLQFPEPPGRLMLGVDDSAHRGESELELARGATVLLYTDGLVERPGSDLDAGLAALRSTFTELAGLPLDDLCDQVIDRLVGGRPDDDVAVVALRLQPPEEPSASSDPTRGPVHHAAAAASWRTDTRLPDGPEPQLTVPLRSLQALSRVRRQARAFLVASLGAGPDDHVAEDVVERAVLVIDELTSNALRHGGQPSTLRIADAAGQWIVIVTDGAADRPPTPAHDRPAGQGGYGLHVISDLTTAHGVHYEPDRKLVWACIVKPA